MADWSNPQLTSTYTNFVTEVKNRDIDLALQFDGTTSSNLATGTIRWSSSANRWQKWSGSTWGELTTTYALTGLSTTGNASIAGTLSVTGATTLTSGGTSTTAATDNNSTNIATTAFVVGQASATTPLVDGTAAIGTSLRYARQDHIHPTDTTRASLASPTFTGTVTIPSGASISGYLTTSSASSTYAPLASPALTGTPIAPTATAGTNTTQLATTAFVTAALATISTVPAGAVYYFAMSTPPTGYLKANGAAVSRTTYATLFAAIGTTFGVGDGATTFNVPDLRGEFVRGWDDSRGVDSGRSFGTAQSDEFKSHQHTWNYYQGIHLTGTTGNTCPAANQGSVDRDTGLTGGTETRPRNIALLACIKF